MGDPTGDDDDDKVVSISDRARGGEAGEEPPEPDEVPAEQAVDADHQLTLNVGAITKSKKVSEAVISLSAAERPINGLLDPDEEIELDAEERLGERLERAQKRGQVLRVNDEVNQHQHQHDQPAHRRYRESVIHDAAPYGRGELGVTSLGHVHRLRATPASTRTTAIFISVPASWEA